MPRLGWEDVLEVLECRRREALEQLPCMVIHVGDLGEKL